MPDVYGFLRFQLPGLLFTLLVAAILFPFLSEGAIRTVASDPQFLLSIIGITIILGGTIGYILHQFSVRYYRSASANRSAQTHLLAFLRNHYPEIQHQTPEQQAVYVEVLLSSSAFLLDDDSLEEVRKKMDGRWSHLYARHAASRRSVGVATVGAATILAFAHLLPAGWLAPPIQYLLKGPFNWSFVAVVNSAAIILAAFILSWRLEKYTPKLFGEICGLELILALAIETNWENVSKKIDRIDALFEDEVRNASFGEGTSER